MLGRPIEAAAFSGSSLPPISGTNGNWTGSVSTEYSANVTTVTDQAGKKRRSVSNALGQLIRIDEPDNNGNLGSISSPNQPTHYHYNTLGKMVRVNQGVQNRYFMHDSLGRLLLVRQPEQEINTALNTSGNPDNNSWTIGFTYDNNGNLLTSRDANNVVITSTYDALNRPLTRSYSDSTPTVTYTYDNSQVPFSKGRLTKISSSISEMRYTEYDEMGRLVTSVQETDNVDYPSEYKYNLAGILVEQTYPSGRVVKHVLDNNGDISMIQSKRNENFGFWNYAKHFEYTASGVIKHLQLGNGLWESAVMNSRNQVLQLRMGNSPTNANLMHLTYDYGEFDTNGNVDTTKNAGNIAKQTISFDGLAIPFVQTYNYDSLDRITEAKETVNSTQTWTQEFGYDRYGNRTSHSETVHGQAKPINEVTLPSVDANTNRFTSTNDYEYDAVGNLIRDIHGRQFTFNGDNKQVEVKDSQNSTIGEYVYDGSGKRIKKITASEYVIFVYDGLGKLIGEYSTDGLPQNPMVHYTATDPLGSPRVLTNENGEIISRRDFMPFGEEVTADQTYRTAAHKYGVGDNVRQKFTGYERDDETGLDFAEARYYNDNHGRFTAVDPLIASGKSANPQTFNRYAYVMNRPMILIDPTGLDPCASAGNGADNCTPESSSSQDPPPKDPSSDTVVVGPETERRIAGEIAKELSRGYRNERAAIQRARVATDQVLGEDSQADTQRTLNAYRQTFTPEIVVNEDEVTIALPTTGLPRAGLGTPLESAIPGVPQTDTEIAHNRIDTAENANEIIRNANIEMQNYESPNGGTIDASERKRALESAARQAVQIFNRSIGIK